jgi:hypothetical protein
MQLAPLIVQDQAKRADSNGSSANQTLDLLNGFTPSKDREIVAQPKISPLSLSSPLAIAKRVAAAENPQTSPYAPNPQMLARVCIGISKGAAIMLA